MSTGILLLGAALLGFAPAPLPKPARPAPGKGDLKELQGTWVSVRRTYVGREMKSAGPVTVEVAGDRLKYLVGGTVRTEWVVTLDTTRNPKVIDRTKVGGAKGLGVVLRGVYRLDGDTLTICYRQRATEAERPADFDGTRPGVWLHVLKRQKP